MGEALGMAADAQKSPYVGLKPFEKTDAPLFFGRDREIRVISSNLQFEPMTVLCGASGVGKSSVLQAGVLPKIKTETGSEPIYFRDWPDTSEVEDLLKKLVSLADTDPNEYKGKLIMLDQFEEFIQIYPPDPDDIGGQIDAAIAQLVNGRDASSKVLIGIREDSLWALNPRLGLRIPGLLLNQIQLRPLDIEGAREAIERPLNVISTKSQSYRIERELVDEILEQGQPSVPADGSFGGKHPRATDHNSPIETVYLQLVLTRLWKEEQSEQSQILRLQTLKKIGGTENIVQDHVDRVMADLITKAERDIAIRLFPYLVTPSGRKIAQDINDLLRWGKAPAKQVQGFLEYMSRGDDIRILRHIAAPAAPEKYELFHDVFAKPVLAWTGQQLAKIERRATIKRWIIGISSVSALAIGLISFYAWYQHQQQRLEAAKANAVAQITRQAAEQDAGYAKDLEKEAQKLESTGNNLAAGELRQIEDKLNNSAKRTKTEVYQLGLTQTPPGLEQQVAQLTKERDSLREQLAEAQAGRSTEPDQASKQQIANLTKQLESLTARLTADQDQINQLRAADQTPVLTQRVDALSRETERLRGQLNDEEAKVQAAERAGLYSALNDYENAFKNAFSKTTANCQYDLNNLYNHKLNTFAIWCIDTKSVDIEEQCDQQWGGSPDAPTLTCDETTHLHLKTGNHPPTRSKKAFKFTHSNNGFWTVSDLEEVKVKQ